MTVVSTRLVPELQYYFNKFVCNSTMNKRLFPIPAPLRIEYFDENRSFIRMLFDDSWTYVHYWYKYIREDSKGSWPLEVQTRLNVYPTSGQYYMCSDSTAAINLFLLQPDDFLLLDRLSHFRRHPEHSSVSDIEYGDLTTNLSKLIYIYLVLKIQHDYHLYNNTTLISDPVFSLECCYEAYVAENVFDYVSTKTVELE
jgi:hypothetical protein